MMNLDEWSYLWENPDDYLIVKNLKIFPKGDVGMIFDKETRYCLGIEDNSLLKSLVLRMLQAGVQSVDSRDFHPEPTEATKIIEEGFAAGLSRVEINQRLRILEKQMALEDKQRRAKKKT